MTGQDLTSVNIVKVRATRLVRLEVSLRNITFHAKTSSRTNWLTPIQKCRSENNTHRSSVQHVQPKKNNQEKETKISKTMMSTCTFSFVIVWSSFAGPFNNYSMKPRWI